MVRDDREMVVILREMTIRDSFSKLQKKQPATHVELRAVKMVGASRFERPTTRTPSEYATRLRHAPILNNTLCKKLF
jgi:hypothetical protein